MLRAFLIVSIIASLAALGVSQLKVAKTISSLSSDLETTKTDLQKSQTAEAKARGEAKKAGDEAAKAKKEKDAMLADFEKAVADVKDQRSRAEDAEKKLEATTLARNQAQQELSRWTGLGKTIEELNAILVENKKLIVDRDKVVAENRDLSRTLAFVKNRLSTYEGGRSRVVLPPTLQGKVTAVDPKYDFVVLNIGTDDGVLDRGEMLVNRSGKLVGKLRIISVSPKRSIANIIPDWKQAEVMEGDVVIVGL